MTSARTTLGAVLLWILLGTVGCDSAGTKKSEQPEVGQDKTLASAGQTGDEGQKPWSPGGAVTDRSCVPSGQTQALDSLEDDTDLGFSAADILDLVGGTQEAQVHWNAEPFTEFYAVQVTPSDLDETLELTLSHDSAPPRYRSTLWPDSDAGLPLHCPKGQLELGVNVKLRSASGTLDEQWWGALVSADVDEAIVVLQAPTWRGRLPNQPDRDEAFFPNALAGKLEVVDGDDPGSALAWIDLSLRMTSNAIDGSVNGWVQDSSGGAFLLPQGDTHEGRPESDGYIGVIGDGFYGAPWVVY
ncbi:MAG: hypothetical protein OEZ06_31345 [Myxococcales bacterium]|nr:hypothetical protein [Myxococcales bacterium]